MSSPPTPVNLSIRNLGHIPSFKNSKLILWSQKRVMTKPEYQEIMEKMILSFESQLRSEFQTRGIAITTGPSALSQIASLLPLDDSFKWMPAHSVNTLLVSKGEEGCDVRIERL